jgi:hypothetical protein
VRGGKGLTRAEVRKRFLWVLNNTVNRATTPLARSGHGPFSLIRHVGRKSGRTYETPVILVRVEAGFIAELERRRSGRPSRSSRPRLPRTNEYRRPVARLALKRPAAGCLAPAILFGERSPLA